MRVSLIPRSLLRGNSFNDEKIFIDRLLALSTETVWNLDLCLRASLTAFGALCDTLENANNEIEPLGYRDLDYELVIAQTEFKNDLVNLKRNLDVANELNKVLDSVSLIVHGKQHEYLEEITGIRKQVEEAISDLSNFIQRHQETVDSFKDYDISIQKKEPSVGNKLNEQSIDF